MKNTEEASSESKIFDFWHLGGQQLSKEDISELREFAISGGYQSGSVLFGDVDEEILGCIPNCVGAKVVNTLTRSIGFLKLERDLSSYRKQHITGSLVYSNFKLWTLLLSLDLLSFQVLRMKISFGFATEFPVKQSFEGAARERR